MQRNLPHILPADNAAIDNAVGLLRQGRLVGFPTETVYGLGANAANPEAVQRIFAAKGRPTEHPLIVHVADFNCLGQWAQNIPDSAHLLAAHFWPGPLALILTKQPWVPMEVTGGQTTVGLRMPNHPVALQLLQAFGGGIAAPSANRFCRISPTLASHVAEELGAAVDLILDGGPCRVGVESTIIDLSGPHPHQLRPGQISRADIEAVLGKKILVSAPTRVRTSGMMAVHYAPATPALLCPTEHLLNHFQRLSKQHKKIGLMIYQSLPQVLPAAKILMPNNVDLYAQALYTSLRELDSRRLDIILIEEPPDTDDWQAIHDRLGKAAAHL